MMMKNLIFIITFLSVALLAGQTTYVPDDNFENYLETHDANGNIVPVGDPSSMGNGIANDNYVTTAKINTVISLSVTSRHITDLTGIEDFTALTHLECQYNQLTALDVSQNTALVELDCSINFSLSSLNLGQNSNLSEIRCMSNQLTNLDVTGLPNLTLLACSINQLTGIDVSQNPELTIFTCSNNQLTDIDISHNPNLAYFVCEDNQLTSLNLKNNAALFKVFCNNNQITELDVSHNPLLRTLGTSINPITELDLTNNPRLSQLFVQYNHLTRLDMRNGHNTIITDFDATNNPNLTCIFVDNVAYSTTNWPNIDYTSHFVATQAECDALDIDDNEFDETIRLYPNPVDNRLIINTSDGIIDKITIVNMLGIPVFQTVTLPESINTSRLQPGMYFVQFQGKNFIITKKLLVKH